MNSENNEDKGKKKVKQAQRQYNVKCDAPKSKLTRDEINKRIQIDFKRQSARAKTQKPLYSDNW